MFLHRATGVPGSDYINANYIDSYRKQNACIATQGPLPETLSDFWRMVWEQRTNTIVMMTRLEEKSRVNVHTHYNVSTLSTMCMHTFCAEHTPYTQHCLRTHTHNTTVDSPCTHRV